MTQQTATHYVPLMIKVEAIQFRPDWSFQERYNFLKWRLPAKKHILDDRIILETENAVVKVVDTDWIVRYPNNSWKVFTDTDFKALFVEAP